MRCGQVIFEAQAAPDRGIAAIEAEFRTHGTADDVECFEYVRHGKTGDSVRRWPNGVLDEGRPAGLKLEWFHAQAPAAAKLTMAMVLALRLYTTSCYQSLNNPLRGLDNQFKPRPLSREQPHPFPVTVHLLTEAIKRLRAVEGEAATMNQPVTLWRGLRGMRMSQEFQKDGGSERAPMSTTSALEVAVKYSASACSVLLKLETESFRERGADLSFVSAFPAEAEVLYPPLTHLRPTGRMQKVEVEDTLFTIIEVKPSFG